MKKTKMITLRLTNSELELFRRAAAVKHDGNVSLWLRELTVESILKLLPDVEERAVRQNLIPAKPGPKRDKPYPLLT